MYPQCIPFSSLVYAYIFMKLVITSGLAHDRPCQRCIRDVFFFCKNKLQYDKLLLTLTNTITCNAASGEAVSGVKIDYVTKEQIPDHQSEERID